MSEGGDGVGLALRLQVEGHNTQIWIREVEQSSSGKGLVNQADEYEFGQTIIADCTGFGVLLDKYRDSGVPVFGGGSFADRLETDRQFAEEVMNNAEIDTPKSLSVRSWKDARKAIEKVESEKVVLKPEGASSGVIPSYVASSQEDALNMLTHFEQDNGKDNVELTVQEFVEGIDVSTEGWFDGEDWIDGLFNHTIERKQLMNDNLGPSGGCTGNVVWSCDSKDPIVKYLLLKLTDILREHRYVGPIDVNCVINDKGFYGLEFTPRFGYDAFPTMLYTLFSSDFGSFISECVNGNGIRTGLNAGFGCGVRLTIPPWPSEGSPKKTSIRGFEERDKQSFYPYGAMLVDEELQSCGSDGSLGVINCSGGSISEGFAKAYEIISRLEISNVQYRTDLPSIFLSDFREIQRILDGQDESEGWIGVDLDGTLAEYSCWSGVIGQPIPKMVQRVRRWVREGKEVRILTARGASHFGNAPKYEQQVAIHSWINKHIGHPLEVTDKKDFEMLRLYDDRVRQVEEGTGEVVGA